VGHDAIAGYLEEQPHVSLVILGMCCKERPVGLPSHASDELEMQQRSWCQLRHVQGYFECGAGPTARQIPATANSC